MVAIQIMSDLHLENPKAYDIFEITPKAPYLALLGDIGYVSHTKEYLEFLRRQLLKFQIVFLVMGNHEPWHSTWTDAKETMRNFERQILQERQITAAGLGEFVLLDRNAYHIREPTGEKFAILGCTLFSRVPAEAAMAVSFGINDFYHTQDWTVEEHTAQFEGDLRWLNEQVSSLRGTKLLVLTHYNPTMDSRTSDPKHGNSPIQSGFASDLSDQPVWLSHDVKAWAFGHTHYNCDYVDEKTEKRVITNQRGYYFNQSVAFQEDKLIEI
ncbi:Ser/Thr protein phosphatase superfamily [Xylariomycetidae sp. FL2044]|nr:Ser/Thr protein phosphatase superfamily [Xylariomycetidae sp. FL2044]